MLKTAIAIGAVTASVFTLSTDPHSSEVRAQEEVPDSPPVVLASAAVEEETAAAPRPERLGLKVQRVPAELAAHLGLADPAGVLVTAVAERSPAQAAGLAAHDVVLTIDGAEADPERLERALTGETEFELEVVRAGVNHRWSVPGSNGQSSFLSTASLAPDHPFRRVASLKQLRESYADQADQASERMRQIDDESRAAREEAKREMQTLQQAFEEEVAAHLAKREKALLERIDAELNPERVESFSVFRIDLAEVVPEERLDSVDVDLKEVDQLCREALPGRLQVSGDDVSNDTVNRMRSRVANLGNEVGNLHRERVMRPWSSARQEVEQHRQRFGQKFDERRAWTEKTLAAIHAQVAERIKCAVKRTREELAKKLASRLKKMEAPNPGEVEASLADIELQLEAMTDRFIRRTEGAIADYEARMLAESERFTTTMGQGLEAAGSAAADLEARLQVVLAKELPETLALEGSEGEARVQLNERYDRARADLRGAVNDGRDATRQGTVVMIQGLKEQKVVAEDSWRDLKSLLSEVLQSAGNDCWKLDGPHLDGRFPRPQPEETKEKKEGEVAFVAR